MREGTISWFFGCHSIIHSYYVVRAWKILYKRYPKFWELICILVHDIGVVGKDYLSYESEKKDHWIKGADIADRLFEIKGYILVMDHDHEGLKNHRDVGIFGDELVRIYGIDNRLFKADKYSYYIASKFWIKTNCLIEPKLRTEKSITKSAEDFKKRVKESIDSGKWLLNHSFYLERCK